MIVTFKSYIQPCIKTSVSLAFKPFLSIVDYLQTTFSPDLPVKCIVSPRKCPECSNRPKSGGQTDEQTDRQTKHSTPAAHARKG